MEKKTANRYGALPIGDALNDVTLESVTRLAFVEGCVGETVAALEAREALAAAQDPAVLAALGRIAPDETRHSELAWRFARWALETGGESVRRVVTEEIARLMKGTSAPATQSDLSEADTLAHGILPASQRRALRREVMERVVLPSAAALLEATRFETRRERLGTPTPAPRRHPTHAMQR